MTNQRIGILHPGEMGISIAASAKNSGCDVYWTSEGRSPATRERAAKLGLHEARTLALAKQFGLDARVSPTADGAGTAMTTGYITRETLGLINVWLDR